MAINIDEVKRIVDAITNKVQSGTVQISRFNDLAKTAQLQYFNDLYGQPAQYQYGSSKPRVAYQMTKKIGDSLRQFITKVDLPVDIEGKATRPSDYVHTSSIRFAYKTGMDPATSKTIFTEVDVKEVRDDEIGGYLVSEIITPDLSYPISAIYDTYIQLYPKNVGNLFFTYLRQPKNPKWAFTLVNNRPVYDSTNSIDFEFPMECMGEIVIRICKLIGINLREQELLAYSEQQKQEGI